jgi:hypothetical protein
MGTPAANGSLAPLLPIRIFLSSPGDLARSRPGDLPSIRNTVKGLVEEFNRSPHYEDRYKFILYSWEDRVPPIGGQPLQRSVDQYNLLPDAADIFVCLFWKRFGSPTLGLPPDPDTGEPYPSGTVYELLTAYRSALAGHGPVLLCYHWTAPAEDSTFQTAEQEAALDRFLARFQAGGDLSSTAFAPYSFAAPADLLTHLREHLIQVVEKDLAERLTARLRQLQAYPRSRALLLPHNLPADYVERTESLNDLRRLVLGSQQRVGVVAVQGLGGLGKTILARALCFDPATQSTLPDGVLWAKFGQQPNILGEQRAWIRALGGDTTAATSVREATALLRELLQDRAMLLVLDDVWQREAAEAFEVGGPRCRLLITTRNRLTAPGAQLLKLDVMHRAESVQLLHLAAGNTLDPAAVDEIATRLGDLPLALNLVGGQLREGISWGTIRRALDERHDVRYLGLEQGQVYAVIASSVDALPSEVADRFHELVIFPPDAPLDLQAVARLWAATAGADDGQAEWTLATLRTRALVQPGNTLHDLVRDYLALQWHRSPPLPERAHRLRDLHAHLAASFGTPEQWPDLPFEELYPWRRLVWHLAESKQIDAARRLVSDGRYLARKISLLGTEAVARDADLAAGSSADNDSDDGHAFQLLAAALRRSAHVLDRDTSQLENQLLGRLGHQLVLHDAPLATAALKLVWPTLAPAGSAELRLFFGHTHMVASCALSADGRLLATASGDNTARLWEVASGKEQLRLGLN